MFSSSNICFFLCRAAIYKPVITSFPNQTVFTSNSSVLHCNVLANPKARISWMKNGKSADITVVKATDCEALLHGHYQLESNKSILVICKAVHNDDSANYTCTAENKLGSVSQVAFLNVLGMDHLLC